MRRLSREGLDKQAGSGYDARPSLVFLWAAAPTRMAQGERRTVSSMAEMLLERAIDDAKRKSLAEPARASGAAGAEANEWVRWIYPLSPLRSCLGRVLVS